MEVDVEGRHTVIVTPLCRHSMRAAVQPLAAGRVHVSLTAHLLGVTLTIELPTLQLASGTDGGSFRSCAARRRQRRMSLSSAGSEGLSRAASDAASLGTVDEAVATLRQRLSEPSGAAACRSRDASLDGSLDCSLGGDMLEGGSLDGGAAAGLAVSDLLRQSGEEMNEACLLRWLAARNHDVDEAEAGLREHARWRHNYIPNGRINEDEISNELAVNKVFLQGCDNEGRPVMIVLAARHDMGARRLDETNRLIVYALDNAAAMADDAARNPLGKFLCLFDLSGLRMNNLDVKALRGIFELLQGHFPERLSQLWFLNAPFIFWGLWRIVSPFIEPATRDKIVFLSGVERTSRLAAAIPPEVLPRQYGGQAELVPAAAAVAARRAGEVQAERDPRRSSLAERPAPADEGRLTAARNATGRWASSAWGGIKRGGAAVTHVRISPPRLPSLPPVPRLHMWWQHDDGSSGSSKGSPAQITLMRQHSIALQRAVAHSVSHSRLAAVSRRLLPTLQPLNPKVLLCKVWAQARRVAIWAWSKAPALRPAAQAGGPGRKRAGGARKAPPPLPLPILPASRLDGGLAPM